MAQWLKGLWRRAMPRATGKAKAGPAEETELMHMISRRQGTAAAYRGAVALLLAAQLLLWLHQAADGRPVCWQAALLLVLPGLGVWALSAAAWRGSSAGPEKLLLLPCLLLDAVWLLSALLSLLNRLMPSYPAWLLKAAIPVLLTTGVLLGRENGAAYGTGLWRRALVIPAAVLVWQTIAQRGTDRLYPLLGEGFAPTVHAALGGLGALWPTAALFAVPPEAPTPKSAGLACVLVPLAAVCAFGLALSCAAPWAADAAMGERLMWLGRSSGNVAVSGLGAAFWLLLLMLGWCVAVHAARRLTVQVFPRLPGSLPALVCALLSMIPLWLWPNGLPQPLTALLPWRLIPWAAALVWAAIRRKQG